MPTAHHRTVWGAPLLRCCGALGLLAVAGWFVLRLSTRHNVNEVLAAAYTERRTMELRIGKAAYAPVQINRASPQSTFDEPLPLLRASAEIANQLNLHPGDPQWLEAGARADLLEFNYTSAIARLERVLDVQSDSTEAMIDLATAYYQRAEKNDDREIDYGIAIEYLGRALSKAPGNELALFNRAIIEQRLHLYQPAAEDWRNYLRIDSTGAWAADAQRQLKEVEQKINSKQSALAQPLLKPETVAEIVGQASLADQLDSRVEDYLRAVIKEWLPTAFPLSAPSPDSKQARVALDELAAVVRKRHQDLWLTDVLNETHGPRFASALTLLSAALDANDAGDYERARTSAKKAERLFALVGNVAAELRAEEEEAYADHLRYDGKECMRLIRDLDARLANRKYWWLRAQTDLEESNCAGLLGNLDTTPASRGTTTAGDHHYTNLLLRGLGFQAVLAGHMGDIQLDFALASKGLQLFWSDQIDLIKGYNFYTDLEEGANVLRLPYLQVALWEEATALADLHADIVQRAMAHHWFGHSAYLAHMPEVAAREFARASSLFLAAPHTEATARGQLEAEVWLIGLETRQGDLEQATDRLERVKNSLGPAPSFGVAIGFYSAQAELSLRRRSFKADESALRSAVFLAEWALQHLHGENARSLWARQTGQAYRDLVAWKLREGDASGALELWEWYKGAVTRRPQALEKSAADVDLNSLVPPDALHAQPVAVPTVVKQQLSLLNNETVITYAVLLDGITAWVYDDRGIYHYWIPVSASELEMRIAQFQRLCSTPGSDLNAVRLTGRTLYNLLIAPLEERLIPGRTLIFEPDDMLSAVAMDALVDHQGHYLLERAPIVTRPGLYQMLSARPVLAINREMQVLVVDVPAPAEAGVRPLSDAAHQEAQAVTASFSSAELLEGGTADLIVIRREMHRAAVFHFIGHALALPERSGLLLAERDPRIQRARSINPQSLGLAPTEKLQLVVLSACNTGLPASPAATGTEGLAEFLLRAGVPHVVASRWNVDSVQTASLMRRFYERLLSGENVAMALRSAQLALADQSDSSHPYYWAAFGVQGV